MPVLFLILAVAAVLMTAFLVWACASIDSGVWVKAVCRDLGPDGKVTLTFDDGPDPVSTPEILDILAENKISAYFFVIGEKAEKHPELVRRMLLQGHHVGNHTYTHSVLFPLSGKPCIEDEIRACDSVIDSASGASIDSVTDSATRISVPRLFRPPFGVTNPDIAKIVKHTRHKVIGWNVRSFDTCLVKDCLSESKADEAIAKCVDRIMSQVGPGSVILLHDRLSHSPSLLRALVSALRAADML